MPTVKEYPYDYDSQTFRVPARGRRKRRSSLAVAAVYDRRTNQVRLRNNPAVIDRRYNNLPVNRLRFGPGDELLEARIVPNRVPLPTQP